MTTDYDLELPGQVDDQDGRLRHDPRGREAGVREAPASARRTCRSSSCDCFTANELLTYEGWASGPRAAPRSRRGRRQHLRRPLGDQPSSAAPLEGPPLGATASPSAPSFVWQLQGRADSARSKGERSRPAQLGLGGACVQHVPPRLIRRFVLSRYCPDERRSRPVSPTNRDMQVGAAGVGVRHVAVEARHEHHDGLRGMPGCGVGARRGRAVALAPVADGGRHGGGVDAREGELAAVRHVGGRGHMCPRGVSTQPSERERRSQRRRALTGVPSPRKTAGSGATTCTKSKA